MNNNVYTMLLVNVWQSRTVNDILALTFSTEYMNIC